jgi:hypothetical protein
MAESVAVSAEQARRAGPGAQIVPLIFSVGTLGVLLVIVTISGLGIRGSANTHQLYVYALAMVGFAAAAGVMERHHRQFPITLQATFSMFAAILAAFYVHDAFLGAQASARSASALPLVRISVGRQAGKPRLAVWTTAKRPVKLTVYVHRHGVRVMSWPRYTVRKPDGRERNFRWAEGVIPQGRFSWCVVARTATHHETRCARFSH